MPEEIHVKLEGSLLAVAFKSMAKATILHQPNLNHIFVFVGVFKQVEPSESTNTNKQQCSAP